jgi:DNA-binding NarL/FixJ family response regulator
MRLVVLDAHPSTRERIKKIFAGSREFEILAVCPDTRSAFVMADSLDPDIFLVDPVLLDADGYAVIRTLRICLPDCAVVAFTHRSSTRAVLKAFQSGAHAFVLKSDPAEALLAALRAVFCGECHISEVSLADLRRELVPETDDEPLDNPGLPSEPVLH